MSGPAASVISAATSLNLSSAFVGIGTTSPVGSEKLGVAGDVYVAGDITANATAGNGIRITRTSVGDNEKGVLEFGYGGTLHLSASIEAQKLSGGSSNILFYNSAGGNKNASPTMTLNSTNGVLIESLTTASSHPANHKEVHVNTDTGKLYRIA